ncbi:cysteine-rich secretory protein 1-like [Rhinoderma darwinii]|uniref:cysteine-rich secretory protein 1-like n=1 Tax=Rhinoderma darwinii TaxID=43563 RepID=UPI003F66AD4F
MIVAHYTQLVADNTFSVGCAVAECPGDPNFCFYVCHYYTAGNAAASLYTPYIQGKPCRKCKAACDGQKLCLNYCPHADRAINCLKAKYYNLCPHPRVKLLCRATCECVNQIF